MELKMTYILQYFGILLCFLCSSCFGQGFTSVNRLPTFDRTKTVHPVHDCKYTIHHKDRHGADVLKHPRRHKISVGTELYHKIACSEANGANPNTYCLFIYNCTIKINRRGAKAYTLIDHNGCPTESFIEAPEYLPPSRPGGPEPLEGGIRAEAILITDSGGGGPDNDDVKKLRMTCQTQFISKVEKSCDLERPSCRQSELLPIWNRP